MKSRKQVIVIGGGASGILAAITAARHGAKVTILERNPRIGKKILATGNGRCNYTNINTNVSCYQGTNPRFAYSALAHFSVQDTIDFFEKLGIIPKIEDLGKVFPRSEQASSVLDVLRYELQELKVNILCDSYVRLIKPHENSLVVILENGAEFKADSVVLAAGGKAMPSSGSDGNAYQLAVQLGHTLIPPFPALVQLKLEGAFFKQIEGVKFVGTAELLDRNKSLMVERGDILFANYGVSGPPILQISRKAGELLQQGKDAILKIKMIDTMSQEELRELLNRRFKNSGRKSLEFSLVGLINKRLIPVLLKQAGFENIKCAANSITAQQREQLLNILQDWRFTIRGTKSWPSAQVTAGGIATDQINPNTMESKVVKGLFFAGEIIDIDGLCGGFNLQWAWSSGYVAGLNAAIN